MIKNHILKKKEKYIFIFFIFNCYLSLKRSLKFIGDSFIAKAYYNRFSLLYTCHLTIGIKELFNKRTQLPHPIGIVIGKNVKIGYDCIIYQNVTIGVKNFSDEIYPIIGNNVTIYANSCICGDITIGNNVTIGAGSLVIDNIPDNAIVAGCPAKLLKFKKTNP